MSYSINISDQAYHKLHYVNNVAHFVVVSDSGFGSQTTSSRDAINLYESLTKEIQKTFSFAQRVAVGPRSTTYVLSAPEWEILGAQVSGVEVLWSSQNANGRASCPWHFQRKFYRAVESARTSTAGQRTWPIHNNPKVVLVCCTVASK